MAEKGFIFHHASTIVEETEVLEEQASTWRATIVEETEVLEEQASNMTGQLLTTKVQWLWYSPMWFF